MAVRAEIGSCGLEGRRCDNGSVGSWVENVRSRVMLRGRMGHSECVLDLKGKSCPLKATCEKIATGQGRGRQALTPWDLLREAQGATGRVG